MSYFIYADLISSFLEPKLANPGSALIHVGALLWPLVAYTLI